MDRLTLALMTKPKCPARFAVGYLSSFPWNHFISDSSPFSCGDEHTSRGHECDVSGAAPDVQASGGRQSAVLEIQLELCIVVWPSA